MRETGGAGSDDHGTAWAGRVAFLTTDDLEGFVVDDHLALEPLAARGWRVDHVPWRDPGVDWDRWPGVLIRTAWDYQDDVEGFLAVLEVIEGSRARLANPLALVRWNVDKSYLVELAARGCPVPPTVVVDGLDGDALVGAARELGAAEVVVKPVVGASGWEAFRARPDDAGAVGRALATLAGRRVLVQPFVSEVVSEGEHSLVFLDGALSHALLKAPAAGDFRVQEEHGGRITPARATPALLTAARRALALLDPAPLYARVDLVGTAAGPLIMELELVEPALYLRTDPGAPARFAAVVDAWLRG